MSIEPGSVEHISEIISQVVGPAFLISVVGSFLHRCDSRLSEVIDRMPATPEGRRRPRPGDAASPYVMALYHRALLLNAAMVLAIISGLLTIVVILASFAAALIGVHHVWIVAGLFIVAASFLLVAILIYGHDVQTGLNGPDLH